MWDEWSYPEGAILPIVTLGTIRPEDSGAAQNAKEFHPHPHIIICTSFISSIDYNVFIVL